MRQRIIAIAWLTVVLALLTVVSVGCGWGAGVEGSPATTTRLVRPGTTEDDLKLLRLVVDEVLAEAGLEPDKQLGNTAGFRCTGTSRQINSGRSALITLKTKRPADLRKALEGAAAALRRINTAYFNGNGTIVDDSSNPRGSVRLRAEGFTLDLDDSVGPDGLSLDAAGPCRF